MKKTKKALLLEKYKNLGHSDDYIEWVGKRYTARTIQSLIDNEKTMDIIARQAMKQ